MPCYMDPPTKDEINRAGEITPNQAKAVLCGVLTALERRDELAVIFNRIDWLEVGVSRELTHTWWLGHKELDAQRREAEAEAARLTAERERAEYERLKGKYGA